MEIMNTFAISIDTGKIVTRLPRKLKKHNKKTDQSLLYYPKHESNYSYSCPKCNEYPPDALYYKANHQRYPKRSSPKYFFNGEYSGHDWDEVNYCSNCKIEFWFENSSI